MSKKRKIKSGRPRQGPLVKSQETINYSQKPPIFSLERLQSGKYCLSSLCQEDKASFSDSQFKRKNISWYEVDKIDRHGLGTEKIPKSAIRAALPPFITDDFSHFIAFRYRGRAPMVGYRQKDVFFVLWFDHDFTLYDHG